MNHSTHEGVCSTQRQRGEGGPTPRTRNEGGRGVGEGDLGVGEEGGGAGEGG